MSTETNSYRKPSILPPRGLLFALVAQFPLISGSWPLRPRVVEVLIGVVLIVAGVVLNVWSVRLFERHAVGVCPFSPAAVLVTRGPYALSRHPMYLGLIAIALGLTIATGVLANMWISVAFAIWLHCAFVLPEEGFLRKLFGAGYDAYAGCVPQWLGPIKAGKQPPQATN
jgi:protein-S-isoprenylcysteine O-methyltransferase Ste14